LVCFFFIISETNRDTTEPDRSEIYVSPEESQINAQYNIVPTPSETISVEVGTSYESHDLTPAYPKENTDFNWPSEQVSHQQVNNTLENQKTNEATGNIQISSPVIQQEVIQESGNEPVGSSENNNYQPTSYNSTDPEPAESTDEDGYINPADALLKFNRTVYNFGTLRDGEKASTLFVFTNIGTEPLEIEVVSACFCMSVDHTLDLIQKGEKGNIDVVFDSNDQVGNVKKDIDVIFKNVDKDGYPLVKRLTIKGKVLPK
jgi:hypothetical protein